VSARGTGRHGRRLRRLTPRRWLPFVALSALVVGAAVIEPRTPELPRTEVDPTVDVATLPAVTRADAISTAWFCGGGTASGPNGEGLAELTVVVANDAPLGATAEVTVSDQQGRSRTRPLAIPAYGRARLVASDVLEADWVGVTVEARGGRLAVDREVEGPLGLDVGPCSTTAANTWYVPSGSTSQGATEYLTLFNPFPDSASVDVSFATTAGVRKPRVLQAFSVPGRSVRVVDVGASSAEGAVVPGSVTDRAQLAATVQVRSGRVVVDRVQTYDGTGSPLPDTTGSKDGGDVPKGLISTAASPVRAPRWLFPGARVAAGVHNRFAIFNPSARAAEVDVVIIPQNPRANGAPEPLQLTIRPGAQTVVDLASIEDLPPDLDASVDVRSLQGVPIVAERLADYVPPNGRTGAAVQAGLPLDARRWLLTSVGPTDARGATVQLANPGDRASRVRVWQLAEGDRTLVPGAGLVLPAGDRRTLDLSDVAPGASLVIEGSRPVVVGWSSSNGEGIGVSLAPAFPYPESRRSLLPAS
jgi:hypothetical protein